MIKAVWVLGVGRFHRPARPIVARWATGPEWNICSMVELVVGILAAVDGKSGHFVSKDMADAEVRPERAAAFSAYPPKAVRPQSTNVVGYRSKNERPVPGSALGIAEGP